MLEINYLLLVIIFILVLIAVLLIIFLVNRNKFMALNVKIKESENEIDILLEEKRQLLLSIYDNIVDYFDDNSTIKTDELKGISDRFIFSDRLHDMEIRILNVFNYKKTFIADDNVSELINKLTVVSNDCLSIEYYYNDRVDEIHKLLEAFPSRVIGRMLGNSKKEKYEHKEEEVFEILKDK